MTAPRYPVDWYVPKGTYNIFFPSQNRHALVIPVINEGERILLQLKEMQEKGISAKVDILLIDGGSTDGSTDVERLRSLGVRALLEKKDVGKLSAQLQMGYAFALQEGYEGIITIDGNRKDGVEAIFEFSRALDEGWDLAHGSRFIKGGKAVRTPLSRYLAIRLIHAPILSLSARHWLTDTTNGYRAYSRQYLLHPLVQPFRPLFKTYELLAYLSVRASQLGLRVKEIPVSRVYPPSGPTPTKIKGMSGYVSLLKILSSQLLRRYEPV